MTAPFLPLVWSAQLETGVPEIDEQHRILVQTLNEAGASLAHQPRMEHLEKITQDLLAYALYHFDMEETLMAETGYASAAGPAAAEHEQQQSAQTGHGAAKIEEVDARGRAVVLHSLRLRKKLPEQVKYNAAQRMAYSTVIVLGILMLLNGLAIYKPVQLNWLCALFGGYETARMIHFIITILFVLFFLVHVIQVILHGWNNFRAMLTGYEVVKETLPPQQTDYADTPSSES